MKHLHQLFVLLVITSFAWRVYLAEKMPEKLHEKWIKLLPHVLATGLLLTGVTLALQGEWVSYGWIVAKVVLMVAFIAFGILTIKQQGRNRWIALAAALYCFIYILKIAVTKQIHFFV